MKETPIKRREFAARLVVYDLDKGPAVMKFVSRWLSKQAKELMTAAQKEQKLLPKRNPTYSSRYVARVPG